MLNHLTPLGWLFQKNRKYQCCQGYEETGTLCIASGNINNAAAMTNGVAEVMTRGSSKN